VDQRTTSAEAGGPNHFRMERITAPVDDVRRYEVHLTESGVEPPTLNGSASALRFFFGTTLDRAELARPPKPLPASAGQRPSQIEPEPARDARDLRGRPARTGRTAKTGRTGVMGLQAPPDRRHRKAPNGVMSKMATGRACGYLSERRTLGTPQGTASGLLDPTGRGGNRGKGAIRGLQKPQQGIAVV